MVNIANPIYDAVFKYLMENERVAKTLLSALLKKEVMEVEVKRHEYTNGTRDKISMFRIDFGARVKESDGSIHLVLIELQKTWLETETLRFRQYLGAQYADPENIIKDEHDNGYGIPMITVYLLGHKVGDIEEPVIYVSHDTFDYDGRQVKDGMKDPFVSSLVHDSIIVQIPRLRGQVNNRLEEILNVFDQSHKDKHNRQVLNIDEEKYAGDPDMQFIIHRLMAAASDAKLRQDMNVEDEYFSAIENRDTAIMNRDKIIKQRDERIAEQEEQISAQEEQISAQEEQISAQEEQISAQEEQISAQEEQISAQEEQISAQEEQISAAIKAFAAHGLNATEIARIMNLPTKNVEVIINS